MTKVRNLASLTSARNGMRSNRLTRDHQPAGGLRHGLDQQHARHQRIAGKMAFENRCFLREPCASALIVRSARLRSTIRSISWKYSRRIGRDAQASLGCDQFVDAGAEVLQHEILVGGRLAVIDFLRPLLERHLDAERLVDGEGDVEEVQAVDAEIVNGVASGVIVSRGISQVSAIILAMVSNVEDIGKSPLGNAF